MKDHIRDCLDQKVKNTTYAQCGLPSHYRFSLPDHPCAHHPSRIASPHHFCTFTSLPLIRVHNHIVNHRFLHIALIESYLILHKSISLHKAKVSNSSTPHTTTSTDHFHKACLPVPSPTVSRSSSLLPVSPSRANLRLATCSALFITLA